MIRVLYDHQAFAMQRFGGISRYFANLHAHFLQDDHVYSTLGIRYTRNHYIQQFQAPFADAIKLFLSNHNITKWNKRYSLSLLQSQKFDVFHPTYYNSYFLNTIKKPFVITVHDMIHEIFPQYFNQNDEAIRFKKPVIEKADHIIAISASTKRDLQHYLNIPEEKITVVYHGCQLQEHEQSFIPPFKKYLLFVGDRRAYKNFKNFIGGVAPVLKEHPDINIICTGGGSFNKEEASLLNDHNILNRVQQMNVSDAQLSTLYGNALAFVFPSLYEGFGFPLLEAFQNNCPVACSNTSSFLEVGGDAVSFFDPLISDDITASINKIIEDDGLRNDLIEKGAKQLQKFSLQKCIDETKQVYIKIVS